MADFFTQLAGRTIGVTSAPRPIIAPLFAPGPSLASNFPTEIAQEHSTIGERAEVPGPGVHVSGLLQASPLQTRPTLPDNAATNPGQNAVHDTPKGQFAPEMRLSPIEKLPRTAQQPEPTVIVPRSVVEPSFPPAAPLSLPPGPFVNQNAHVSSSRERPPESSQRTSPVIKVSIGRIDVRAVMPSSPAQSRKASPPVPQPSLNEYLEARNRGKR